MIRVLPAHAIAAATAIGLAAPNALRLEPRLAGALLPLACAAVCVTAPASLRMAAAIALAVALGWWWGSARLDALDRSPLLTQVDRSDRALVEVTGEARTGAFDLRIPARVRRFGALSVNERAQLELPLGRAPPQGALISALVVVRLPRGPSNGFDERTWLRRQGIHVVLHVDEWSVVGRRGGIGAVGDRLRAWLRRASAPGLAGERRAVLEGILLGDDNQLSDGLKTSFRRSGLYHLLAVSGQNVVLLACGVLALAWVLGLPRYAAHVGSLGAIGAYVFAVGPQPSVIRAAVSGAAVSIAWLSARERDPWHVLLLAAVVLLAWNPYTVFDAGFQLSFAAVVAIFLFARPLAVALEGYPLPQWLRGAVAISVACSAVTAPILWLQFGRVPLLGVLANALAELAIAPLLGLAFAAAIIDPVAPPIAELLAWVNGWLAAYVTACARVIGAVPFAQASGRSAGLAVAVVLACGAYAWRRWRTSSSRRI